MFLSRKRIENRDVRVFRTANGDGESFHLLGTDLNILTENPDAMCLYMAVLWNKQDTIRWKDKRFNDALTWLVDKRIMQTDIVQRYWRTNGNAPRSESV